MWPCLMMLHEGRTVAAQERILQARYAGIRTKDCSISEQIVLRACFTTVLQLTLSHLCPANDTGALLTD